MARARWAKAKARIAHRRLLFIDESGAKTNMTRLYGRALRGQRVYDSVPNGRWETTTMIAAIGCNGAQAPWVLDGPMDGDAFAVCVGYTNPGTHIGGGGYRSHGQPVRPQERGCAHRH